MMKYPLEKLPTNLIQLKLANCCHPIKIDKLPKKLKYLKLGYEPNAYIFNF